MPPNSAKLSMATGLVLVVFVVSASVAETGRIKHHRPSASEAARQLSEEVMNDDSLRVGDIVVTDRGFFVFEGLAGDGITNQFRRIPAPRNGAEQPFRPSGRPATAR